MKEIYDIYDQLFEESLKVIRLNRFALKKLHDLELETEGLEIKIEETTRSV